MVSYFVPMAINIHTLVVGPFAVNCYLVWDQASNDGLIIDPGAEAEQIGRQIDDLEINPKAILLTHGHGDHIAAVAELKRQYDIPLYVGVEDESLLADPGANISAFFDHPIVAPKPDHQLIDEQLLTIAGLDLLVLATPGHTAGGVCFLHQESGQLFCGDTLFASSIGRTDLPGGNHQQLIDSINAKIMTLPDDIVCYPGHGATTTVGTERRSNPFLIGGYYA